MPTICAEIFIEDEPVFCIANNHQSDLSGEDEAFLTLFEGSKNRQRISLRMERYGRELKEKAFVIRSFLIHQDYPQNKKLDPDDFKAYALRKASTYLYRVSYLTGKLNLYTSNIEIYVFDGDDVQAFKYFRTVENSKISFEKRLPESILLKIKGDESFLDEYIERFMFAEKISDPVFQLVNLYALYEYIDRDFAERTASQAPNLSQNITLSAITSDVKSVRDLVAHGWLTFPNKIGKINRRLGATDSKNIPISFDRHKHRDLVIWAVGEYRQALIQFLNRLLDIDSFWQNPVAPVSDKKEYWATASTFNPSRIDPGDSAENSFEKFFE